MSECDVCLGATTVSLNTFKRENGTYMVTGQRVFPCPNCHRVIINRDAAPGVGLKIQDTKSTKIDPPPK